MDYPQLGAGIPASSLDLKSPADRGGMCSSAEARRLPASDVMR
jgi:hypothetical protein